MNRSSWKPLVAIAMALALLGGATAGAPAIANIAFLAAFVCLGLAIGSVFLTRRDKYDLDLLAEVHERGATDDLEIEEPDDYGSVHCIHCGTVYSMDMQVCPECGRR